MYYDNMKTKIHESNSVSHLKQSRGGLVDLVKYNVVQKNASLRDTRMMLKTNSLQSINNIKVLAQSDGTKSIPNISDTKIGKKKDTTGRTAQPFMTPILTSKLNNSSDSSGLSDYKFPKKSIGSAQRIPLTPGLNPSLRKKRGSEKAFKCTKRTVANYPSVTYNHHAQGQTTRSR